MDILRARRWLAVCIFLALAVFTSGKLTAKSRAVSRAPTAAFPVILPGEFEPQRQLIVAWAPNFEQVYSDLVASASQSVDVVVLAEPADRDAAVDELLSAGANMRRVRFVHVPVQSMWMRDYGPIVARRADGRLYVVDAQYPHLGADDKVPSLLAPRLWHQPSVKVPMIIEGGNLLSNGRGTCVVTEEAIANDMYRYPATRVHTVLRRHFGCMNTVVVPPLPGEATGHVDMFVALTGPWSAIVGRYLNGEDPVANRALDKAARRLRKAGFRVRRIPMADNADGQTRSYTNLLIINDRVLVPVYVKDRRYQQRAMRVLRRAFPHKLIVPIDADAVIEFGGALHCIAQNVPR